MNNTRNYGLDALRAMAITTVILAHGGRYLPGRLSMAMLGGATLGVELFYALSGFLIGNILFDIQQNGPNIKQVGIFLIRRWMRTLPLYYVMIFFLLRFPWFDDAPVIHLWSYLTLTQNFFTPMPNLWFGPSWSLIIEEWSYVVMPLLAFGLYRKSRNPVLFAAFSLCAIGWIARIVFTDVHTNWDEQIRKFVPMRADAIAYGVILAYCCRQYSATAIHKMSKRLLPVSLSILASFWIILMLSKQHKIDLSAWPELMLNGAYGRIFMLPLVGMAFGSLVPLSFEWQEHGAFGKVVRYISKISYALYLSHWPFLFILDDVSRPFQFPVFLIGSLITAALFSWLIEYPVMRLRPRNSYLRKVAT